MKSAAPLFAQERYTALRLILPQPYKLFHKSLLDLSGESFPLACELKPAHGFELFLKVMGVKSSAYLKSQWSRLSENQKRVFLQPPLEVHTHWVRISRGYKESERVQEETGSDNPFYHTLLYPWEIIKDKVRNAPAFSSDVYDQLIQEAMAPMTNVFKPAAIYKNLCVNFEPEKEHIPFRELPDFEKRKYELEAQRKLAYAKRRQDFRRAKKPHREFSSFSLEYSREVGESLVGKEKSNFIQLQWEIQLNDPNKREAIYKELALETRLSMVMDYIFEYNEVCGCKVDWRDWRQRVCGDFHYLDRILFPYVVNHTETEVELRKAFPPHLGWNGPVI